MKNMRYLIFLLGLSGLVAAHITPLTNETFKKFITTAKVPTIVDFSAKLCGPCKQMEPLIKELDGQWAGKYSIGTIDIDEAEEIAKTYGIKAVPTFVVFREGKEIGRFSGFHEAKKFSEKVEDIIKGKKVEEIPGAVQAELSLDQQLIMLCSTPSASAQEVKKILDKGANPNYIMEIPLPEPNKTLEITPLLAAHEMRNTEVIRVLLDAGADKELKTRSVFTNKPSTIIEQLEQHKELTKDIKKLLLAYQPKEKKAQTSKVSAKEAELLNQQLFMAIAINSATDVKQLLEKGANPNYSMKVAGMEIKPLALAINNATTIEVIPLLLDAGATLDCKVTTQNNEILTLNEFLDKRLAVLEEKIAFLKSYKKPAQKSKNNKK